MDNFKEMTLFQKRQMAIEDLCKYYAEYRRYQYDNGSKLKCVELRKKIYFLIRLILKIDQVFSKEEVIVLNDDHVQKTEGPKIFACTHIGGNDIQRTFQIINEPAYLMLGDPGILYKMPIYQALKLNGVIPLETKDRYDRKIAYNRSIELLNNGGNLLIYPEGAWNVSPNVIVMKLFAGTVRLAKETGAEIVPIAVEQYDNKFYFNIGKNYTISRETDKTDKELTDDLRDKLATLKWNIMESQPQIMRKDIPNDFLDDFQSEIVGRCNYGYGFSLDDALSESFHDKNIYTEDDVYSFLDNLRIGPHNAFLAKQKIIKK